MKFFFFLLVFLLIVDFGQTALRAQADLGRVLPAGRPLHVLAFGDYGSGNLHQADVARAMERRNHEMPFDLGVTMGDNFFRCGVHGIDDAQWKSHFEDFYSPLGIKIYATLGTNDYGHPAVLCPGKAGSADAEVARTQHSDTWRMPARYYTFVAGPVRFFAIDTEGWSKKQLEWLQKVLASSQSEEGVKWRIVYGHHPMYTSGANANEHRIAVMRERLEPVFKENHVDLYLAGHDQHLEHLRKDGVDYAICGASGTELRKVHHTLPESLFHATTYGFVDLVIDEHRLAAVFYDTELHSLEDPPVVVRKD
jgi:tartrate-resistant acid phosphatase type 5